MPRPGGVLAIDLGSSTGFRGRKMEGTVQGEGLAAPERGEWTSIARLQELMGKEQLDAVVAVSPWNLIYSSGCQLVLQDLAAFNESRERFAAAIVLADGDPVLTVWAQEEAYARATSWITDVRPAKSFDRTVDVLASVLSEKGLANGRIGIEKKYMDVGSVELLAAAMPGASFEAADDTFSHARMVKSPFEIQMMGQVSLIAAKATQLAWELARPGDAEYSVAANMVYNVIRQGAAPMVFNMGAGPNSAFGHRWANDKVLKQGDIFHSDTKARLFGYWADVTRMAVVGEPSEYQATVYRKLVAVEREVIDRMRPGVLASELYEVSRAAYKREGLNVQPRLIGHGIGLCLHEEPVLTPDCDIVLKPGMTITVEPTHYGPGERYHYEDIVLVTETEPRILSNYCDTSEIFAIR